MPIDTERFYNPKMKCPLYAKLALEEFNDYTLFGEYEIRVPDEENGEEGPYNYVFNAILIAKEKVKWSEIPNLVTAYIANTRDIDEAVERIHPASEHGSFKPDDELLLLIFMREDEAKTFVVRDNNTITPQEIEAERRIQ